MREKQPTWPFHEICKRAKELVLEFFEIHEPQPPPRRSDLGWWCPPQAGFFKANFDATFFDGSGSAGIGVAIRDQSGQIIVALSQKIKLPHLVDLAEALACSHAALFAQELSLFQVVVPRVRSRFNHICILPCLSGVMYIY